jgi:uncharacterized Ntn-hydrolase superfamily protein
MQLSTFSIVAYDPRNQEWGVAVQSKFLAVGAVVPWAHSGKGAVATQSYVNVTYGPVGLDMMSQGISAEETIAALIAADDGRDLRQVGMVDQQGRAAAFTGSGCYDWAGHQVGSGFACQGNILVPGTIEAMFNRFEEVRGGEGELSDWLVSALAAAQEAGGDKRGKQSAALLVVRGNAGYGGYTDRYVDLRVDDDPEPIQKLQQLLELHHLFFGKTRPEDLIPIANAAEEIQIILQSAGYRREPPDGAFDEATRSQLSMLVGIENLEDRWNGEGDQIDRQVVDYLKNKYHQE